VLYVVVWSGGMTWLILFVIDRLIGLRASEEDLAIGLDLAEQSQFAYSDMGRPPTKSETTPST
jgi:ammonia channel protein AmtB